MLTSHKEEASLKLHLFQSLYGSGLKTETKYGGRLRVS